MDSLDKLNKPNPLQKMVQKSLSLTLDDTRLQNTLKALSELYGNESLATIRKNLQLDIDKRKTSSNRSFLEALAKVNEELGKIEKQVDDMSATCEDMDKQLEVANTKTAHLIQQTASLKQQIQQAEEKKVIVEKMLNRFTLTPKELATLHDSLITDATGRGVDQDFFSALSKLQQIHEDCRALLVTENQRLGMEVLETTSRQEEKAYEKLYRWTQGQTNIMSKDYPDITPAFRSAMRALRGRPLLFQTIMDEVAKVRRNALVRMFLDALTRGGPNGTPRPIEVHAHDPLRYVGDMLSWIHQAAMEERETLEQMFPEKQEDLTGKSLEEVLSETLDNSLEGCCRPLQMRVDGILSHQNDPMIAYKIGNVINFYANQLTKVIGPNTKVTNAVKQMMESNNNAFLDALRAYGAKMVKTVGPPPQDLQPQTAIKDAIVQLKNTCATLDKGIQVDRESSREEQLSSTLQELVEPIITASQTSSSALDGVETQIYLINALGPLYSALLEYSFTITRAQEIQTMIEQAEGQLVQAELQTMIRDSGMKTMFDNLGNSTSIELATLQKAVSALDNFAAAANLDGSASLARLTSPRIARSVTKRALDAFMELYQQFYTTVHKEDRFESVSVRPPAQLKTLFGEE